MYNIVYDTAVGYSCSVRVAIRSVRRMKLFKAGKNTQLMLLFVVGLIIIGGIQYYGLLHKSTTDSREISQQKAISSRGQLTHDWYSTSLLYLCTQYRGQLCDPLVLIICNLPLYCINQH